MNAIAGGSIGIILGLVVMSSLCVGCSEEIILVEDGGQAEPRTNKVLENDQAERRTETILKNPATEVLESEIIMILISTFVTPVATRVIKERFDIDVTEKQISMVMQD